MRTKRRRVGERERDEKVNRDGGRRSTIFMCVSPIEGFVLQLAGWD